ncbi:MAG TPA: glycosyltransferase family 2 protein [Chloroflexota bacterium]|nr:glycosyltransferase family 2 protein [Chloroflexota bacterium]
MASVAVDPSVTRKVEVDSGATGAPAELVTVMGRGDRLAFALLMAVALMSVGWYALWWFQPAHIPRNWTTLGALAPWLNRFYFLLLTFVVWRGLAGHVFQWWLTPSMVRPIASSPMAGLRVALMTCIVPGKEPIELLERCLLAMLSVRYAHDTWVLDEGDDTAVKALCHRLGVKHFTRFGKPELNQPRGAFLARTKAGNHNAWHAAYGLDYDVVGQMDMDYICQPDLFEKTLGYFRNPRVAFVGGPQVYGNVDQSFVARGAAQQAYGFFGACQMGAAGKGFHLFIGTVHVVRTAALRSIGGYASHIVEDHITGMRLYAKGWQSVYVPEVLAVGEGPATWSAYFAQQMRWSYGCIDIFLRHLPRHWRSLSWRARIGYANFEIFWLFGFGQFLGLLLLTLYFLLGWTAAAMNLSAWLVHAFPAFLVVWAIYYWHQRYYLRPEERGWNLAGHLLMQAVWPVVALAFFQAALNRKLQYVVTPKGSAAQRTESFPFTLQLAMATPSGIGLLAIPLTHRLVPLLVFWALLNLVAVGGLSAAWLWSRRGNSRKRYGRKSRGIV